MSASSQTAHTALQDLRVGAGPVDWVRAVASNGVDDALDVIGGGALHDSVELVEGRDRIGTLTDFDLTAQLGVRGLQPVVCRLRRSLSSFIPKESSAFTSDRAFPCTELPTPIGKLRVDVVAARLSSWPIKKSWRRVTCRHT